jgi:hypothetical protein
MPTRTALVANSSLSSLLDDVAHVIDARVACTAGTPKGEICRAEEGPAHRRNLETPARLAVPTGVAVVLRDLI